MPYRNSTIISNLSMTNFSSFILLHPLSPSPSWIILKQFLDHNPFLHLRSSFWDFARVRVCVCVCVCVCSHLAAWGILISWLGMEPTSLALRPQSPNHWTIREAHPKRLLLLLSSYGTPFRTEHLLGTKSAVLISTSFFFFQPHSQR